MSRDDAPEDEEEQSTADRQREPERVIDADADVGVDPAEGTTAGTETAGSDTEPDESGTEPDESGTEPDESGTEPDESDTETAGGDTETAESDTEPDERNDNDPGAADTTDNATLTTGEEPAAAADTEGTASQTAQTDADGTGEPAMRSGSGLLLGYGGWTLLMLFLQIVATVGLVGVTAQSLPAVGGPLIPPGIPSYVYVYAGIGAVGYTFTRAVTVDVTTERIGDWTIRIFAALPLAAATYLLVTIAVAGGVGGNEELTQPQLALVALLTGLFVNTAYARLDAAADRLLGPSR